MALFAVQPGESEEDKLQRLAAILSEETEFDGFFRPSSREHRQTLRH
jgi:hypothetical protein